MASLSLICHIQSSRQGKGRDSRWRKGDGVDSQRTGSLSRPCYQIAHTTMQYEPGCATSGAIPQNQKMQLRDSRQCASLCVKSRFQILRPKPLQPWSSCSICRCWDNEQCGDAQRVIFPQAQSISNPSHGGRPASSMQTSKGLT